MVHWADRAGACAGLWQAVHVRQGGCEVVGGAGLTAWTIVSVRYLVVTAALMRVYILGWGGLWLMASGTRKALPRAAWCLCHPQPKLQSIYIG